MDGRDLGDLGVLLAAALVAGEEAHYAFEAGGKKWVLSMRPVGEAD